MISDSGLPSSMWDLAVKSAVYCYNRIPHSSVDMRIPLTELAPCYEVDLKQLKRFGCVAVVWTPRNSNIKFGEQEIKGVLVGYIPTGFLIYAIKENKIYESRHVRFIEEKMYKDLADSKEKEKCSVENLIFDDHEKINEITETEGEN